MSWHWQFRDSSGATLSGTEETLPEELLGTTFPSQGEAETWIGEEWRELLARGVESVILFEDGRAVYGPMSLRPPD